MWELGRNEYFNTDEQAYLFIPIAAETTGAINTDDIESPDDLGRRITQVTDDNREKAFLYHRLSVLIQRYLGLQRGRHSRQLFPHNL